MTRSTVRLFLGVVALSMLRLWLASGQTLTALGHAKHDDQLFLNLAQHIAGGRWLGPFDNLTLAKEAFFPMWIAASFVAGIPLQLSQNLLYIAACVVTILALRPVVRSGAALVAIYAVLLFNPIMFGITVTRILREGIYIPLTLLLAACLIGLFLRCRSPLRSLAIWAAGAGLALGGLWLTRGESIWVLPPVLFILAAPALWMVGSRVDHLWRRVLLLLSPFAVLGAGIAFIATINWFSYGIFVVTEVAGSDWLAAYGALSRVEHDSWKRYVVVPRHVRERIYRVSPAFAELRSAFEGEFGRGWMSHGCKMMPETCGDITAGWFMWLLRDAVAGAGHYRTAPMAVGYYRRLADEVNAACDSGSLRCGPRRATMRPPWRREYGPLVLRAMATGLRQVVRFEGISAHSSPSVGDELTLLPFRMVTRGRLAPSEEGARLRVNGWGFSPTSDLLMTVQDSASTPFEVGLRSVGSPDMFDHCVATKGPHCDRQREARFTLTTPCVRDCRLVIKARGQDRVLGRLSLGDNVRTLHTPELQFHIESITADGGRLRVNGWGFNPTSDLVIAVQDSARTQFEVDVRRVGSQDMFDSCVATKGPHCDRQREARFTLSTPCVRDCRLVIRARGQDRVLGTLPLGVVRTVHTPELQFHIESITKENDVASFGMYGVDSIKLRILTGLIWLYGRVAPILMGILVVTLVAAPIAVAFGYRSALLVPILTLVGAAIARIGLFALIDATAFPSINPWYLGPLHALLLLAGLLACVDIASAGSAWVRREARWPGRAGRVGVIGDVSDRNTGRNTGRGAGGG